MARPPYFTFFAIIWIKKLQNCYIWIYELFMAIQIGKWLHIVVLCCLMCGVEVSIELTHFFGSEKELVYAEVVVG